MKFVNGIRSRVIEHACELNHQYIGAHHFILEMLDSPDFNGVFSAYNLTKNKFRDEIVHLIQAGPSLSKKPEYTIRCLHIIGEAEKYARQRDASEISRTDMLKAICREGESIGVIALKNLGVDIKSLEMSL